MFDPATMEAEHRRGDDVPAWFLDTDYNGLCFHVCQAFFPRTSAWDNLKKALKGDYDDSVWDHLAGTTSAPFEPGEHEPGRGEGDRRPRQRVAGRQEPSEVARGRDHVRVLGAEYMSGYEVPQPILNSPFEEPAEHWHIVEGETARSASTGGGRRSYFYRDPKAKDAPGHELGRSGRA